MLELKRSNDGSGFDKFKIKTDEGSFKIYLDSDLCLYWCCNIPYGEDIKDTYKYTITKDNTRVYSIFEQLYDSVVTKRPFKYFKYDDDRKYLYYDDNNLVKDSAIEWHSDDFTYDAASVLMIDKDIETDNLEITFNKSKVVYDDISPFSTFSVKISTGESRYDPYNATFVNMYEHLINYCNRRGYTFSRNSSNRKKRVKRR